MEHSIRKLTKLNKNGFWEEALNIFKLFGKGITIKQQKVKKLFQCFIDKLIKTHG